MSSLNTSSPAPIDNDITNLCNIKYPIFLGGMGYIASPELVAAVSNAGGCGILSSFSFGSPNALRAGIQQTRSLIKNNLPFGVNISYFTDKNFLKSLGFTVNIEEYNRLMADVIIDEGIPIVETTGTTLNSEESIKNIVSLFRNKSKDIIIIHKCHTISNAIVAKQYGANIISLDSFEAGGHHGEYEITNLVLLPLAKRILSNTPLIVSGGIVNGEQFGSMLVLGAQGIKLGTRFIATVESNVNVKCKLAILNANNEKSTIIAYRDNIPTSMRVYNSDKARQVNGNNNNNNGGNGSDNFIYTFDVKEGMINGKIDEYVWSIGQGVALIDDIPTCKEVIERMVNECRNSIQIKSKL